MRGRGLLLVMGVALAGCALPKAAPIKALDDQVAIKGIYGPRLVAIARSGYTAAVAGSGSGLLSNNGGSIVSQGGSNLISNNGGAIVSQGGSNLISNNGGAIVSQGGSNYRARRLLAATAINVEPQAGEAVEYRCAWPDGQVTLGFTAGATTLRRVEVRPDGTPLEQTIYTDVVYWAPRKRRTYAYDQIVKDAAGNDQLRATGTSERGFGGGLLKTAIKSRFEDRERGLSATIEALDLDYRQGKGQFKIAFPDLGWIETGTLRSSPPGGFLSAFDPLSTVVGSSTVVGADGKVVFEKSQSVGVNGLTRGYRFADGSRIETTWDVDGGVNTGVITGIAGEIAADVVQRPAFGGGIVFEVKPRNGTAAFKVGFGPRGEFAEELKAPSDPPPLPAGRELWWVLPLAGDGAAGAAEGSPERSALDASFHRPVALAWGRKGFYAADEGGNRIRLVAYEGPTKERRQLRATSAKVLAGTGAAGGADGPAAGATFSAPAGLAVAADDTLYVAEAGGHRIRRIAPDGTVTTVAGNGTAGHADGPGASARFSAPTGLALDGTARLLVADTGNRRVRAIDLARPGFPVTTLAGSGAAGDQDGQGAAARFQGPTGLALRPDGTLLIADPGGRRIRAIAPDGTVTTFAGDGRAAVVDGPRQAAGLGEPYALALGPDGTLYGTDRGHTRVFRIRPDGAVQTLAGGEPAVTRAGSMRDTSFREVAGLTVEPATGHVIATDRATHYLMQLFPLPRPETTP